jgi:hypothetical protein
MNLPAVCRTIPEAIVEGRRLGRHVEHDPRSRAFVHPDPADLVEDAQGIESAIEAWTASLHSSLVSKVWRFLGQILNQGEVGSCTGEAMTNLLNCEPFQNDAEPSTFSQECAVDLYSRATTLDKIPGHYPPDDTGSSGLAVCKAAKQLGLITSYRHAFTLTSLLHWLATKGPAIIGIEWFEGFDTPQGPDAELVISGSVRGGHEICIHEIDVEKRRVRGIQSWGGEWGDQGFFTLSWDTLGQLLSRQGDATLPERAA